MLLDLGSILIEIFGYLPHRSRKRLALTCNKIWQYERSSVIWDKINIYGWSDKVPYPRLRKLHLRKSDGIAEEIPKFPDWFPKLRLVAFSTERAWYGPVDLTNSPTTLRSLRCNDPAFQSLPSHLTQLRILYFDGNLPPRPFPLGLLRLTIDVTVSELRPRMLPSTLIQLKLHDLQETIQPGVLPTGLLDLFLGNYRGAILAGSLPAGLRCYGQYYRLFLESDPTLYPSGITHLTIGYGHHIRDQLFGLLYIFPALTHLRILGQCYYKSECVYPKTLRYLEFEQFCGTLEHQQLPRGLTHLIIHDRFNQPITRHHIPPGLTHLVLGDLYNINEPREHVPDSVEYLQAGGYVYTRRPEWTQIPGLPKLHYNEPARVPYDSWWKNALPYRISLDKDS